VDYNFLKRTLATDLANAHTVKIICCLLLPTWRLRHELERVARRGGSVQLVLAGKSDVRLLPTCPASVSTVRSSNEAWRSTSISPRCCTPKMFIVDEQVYVGSSNLDARSLKH